MYYTSTLQRLVKNNFRFTESDQARVNREAVKKDANNVELFLESKGYMVAGHLQEKKGLFYIVLSYQDVDNNRKTKWIPTNLPVKGNKKRAEQMLWEAREKFKPPVERGAMHSDMPFCEYLEEWL